MNDTRLAYLSVAEQATLIRKKEISPVELVEIYLGRSNFDSIKDGVQLVAASRCLTTAISRRRSSSRRGCLSYGCRKSSGIGDVQNAACACR